MLQNHDLRLLLLIAMQAEAQPIIDRLQLEESNGFAGFPYRSFSGRTPQRHEICLLTSGLDPEFKVDNTATQHAAVAAALGIHVFKPHAVVNAGTAGGFKVAGSQIGDIYMIQDFMYHDRRIPISGFRQYGIGGYQMKMPQEVRDLFATATVSTGNSLDITEEELKVMRRLAQSSPVVKEMEAAAIAEMCTNAGVPLLSIKSITDIIDGSKVTAEEFLGNLQRACVKLQEALSGLLEILTEDVVHEIRLGRNRELIDKVMEFSKNT